MLRTRRDIRSTQHLRSKHCGHIYISSMFYHTGRSYLPHHSTKHLNLKKDRSKVDTHFNQRKPARFPACFNTTVLGNLNRSRIICESSIICIPAKHTINMFPHVLIPLQSCQTAAKLCWKEAYRVPPWFSLTTKLLCFAFIRVDHS